MKEWKRKALEQAREDIIELMDDGHNVETFTDYHWRIDGIDVYPSSKKYIKGGRILHYENLKDVTQT